MSHKVKAGGGKYIRRTFSYTAPVSCAILGALICTVLLLSQAVCPAKTVIMVRLYDKLRSCLFRSNANNPGHEITVASSHTEPLERREICLFQCKGWTKSIAGLDIVSRLSTPESLSFQKCHEARPVKIVFVKVVILNFFFFRHVRPPHCY